MDIIVTDKKDSACFAISGEIDERGAEILNNRFQKLDTASLNELVLDFEKVDYIGSSAIGQLILFYQSMASHGGRIWIKNPSKDIHELLLDLDIDKIISF